jgi:hypothetical protein
MTDSQPVPETPPVSAPARTAVSIAAIVSLGGGLLLLVLHMTVRIVMAIPALTWQANPGISFVVGLLGLLSIIPIVSGVALGHVGLVATSAGKAARGRAIAVAGLVTNYLLLVLFLNRLIVVAVVLATGNGSSSFIENFAYYN